MRHAPAQEHFYLEPNCSLVVPGEAGEVTIISSTQVRPGGMSQAQRGMLLPKRRSGVFPGESVELGKLGRACLPWVALRGWRACCAGHLLLQPASRSMMARLGTNVRATCTHRPAQRQNMVVRVRGLPRISSPASVFEVWRMRRAPQKPDIMAHVLGLPAHNVFSMTMRLFLLKCSACAGPREEPEHGGARAGPARAQGVQQDQAPGRRLWRQGNALRARQVCSLDEALLLSWECPAWLCELACE